jgi:hypothetical protein
MSEIGIPYDMDNKKAYTDGKYTGQYSAMDANNYALEGAGISFTLWNYCADVLSLLFSLTFRMTILGVIFGMERI